MTRLLVCGDLHLKPAASDYDLDAVAAPDDADGVVVLGDLTHRAGPDDIALARRFVDRFESVPVVYVPGNHDPAPAPERVVDPLDGAVSGHRSDHAIDGVTVVCWGCEARTLSPAIDQCAFDALDPRDVPPEERRYAADRVADDLEDACHDAVCGTATRAEAADTLGIAPAERAAFERGLAAVEETYDRLDELLADRTDVLLATHVPPFNTSFDRHHAVGTREEDREYLHVGSIALALAIREHDVFAAFSGHSHTHGYDVGTGRDGRPHRLNLGFRGIGTVTLDPPRGEFAFSLMTDD